MNKEFAAMQKTITPSRNKKLVQTESSNLYSGKSVLLANERCLRNYNRDIVSKLSMKVKNSKKVLEFGAGIGTLAIEWEKQTGVLPECLEIDSEQRQLIIGRGLNCYESIESIKFSAYDTIYTSNVLEHIEDDIGALETLYLRLRSGGHLVIYVPAFMCLWSPVDEAIGHYRRYTNAELKNKVEKAGFKVVDSYYADSVGFFAWFYLRLKGYKAGVGVASDKGLIFYDRVLYPISRFLDFIGFRLFLGKNLLLVAIK